MTSRRFAEKAAEVAERDRARRERRKRYPGLHVLEFWLQDMDDQLTERPWSAAVRQRITAARSLVAQAIDELRRS
jgi:hypothetical protein